MSISITHTFVSAYSDPVDPTLLAPSHWNAAHTLTPGMANQLPSTDAAGTGTEWRTLDFTSAAHGSVAYGAGTITLSLAQAIGTTSTPTFGGLTIANTGSVGITVESTDHSDAWVMLKRTGNGYNDQRIRNSGGNLYFEQSANDGTTWVTTFVVDAIGCLKMATVQTTVNGDSGTLIWSEPFGGTAYKKVAIFLNAFTKAAGSTITFSIAFSKTPYLHGDASAVALTSGLSTSAVTVTNGGGAVTGWIFIEGY